MSVEMTITKGKTVQGANEWVKAEYTLKVSNLALEEVDVARATLEGKIDTWLAELAPKAPTPAPATPTPTPAPTPMRPSTFFPGDLSDLLTFEEKADHWIVKPKTYLGAENFAKIADIVRKKGGEYVSAGKESHFRIPK